MEDYECDRLHEDQEVSFASFILQVETEYWWEIVREGAEISGNEIVQRFLIEKFSEKYFSEMARDKLALEFQELK